MPAEPRRAARAVPTVPTVPTVPAWLPGATLTVSLLGLAASAYLTLEHFTSSTTLACPETGVVNCAKVTTSSYSSAFGIPVAILGLVFFVAMVTLSLPAAWRRGGRALRLGRVGAVSVGAVFVLYLLWAELFRINAICLWCTAVHVLTLVLFAIVALGTALAGPVDAKSGRR
jgi:uncharacterized membrane protein